MSGCRWEETIALLAGEDLAGDESAAARAHLADCAGCCELFDQLQADRAALLSDVAPALSGVSGAVMAALAHRRRRLWWLAAAPVAATIWLAMLIRPLEELPRRVPAAPAPPEFALVRHTPARVAEPPARPRPTYHVPKEPVLMAAASEPTVIRLLTNDPDVVIYWIAQ